MIEAINICKSFGEGALKTEVLRNVSVKISEGKFTAIVGPSGSGKSTLLNLFAGIETADSGEIRLGDITLRGKSAEFLAKYRLQHIGLVFQFFNLLPTLSLRENVALAAYLAGRSKRDADLAAENELALVGLSNEIDRLPHQVSGGEIQRTAIARALVNKPRVVLADEPTGSLDRANGDKIFNLFLELTRSRGVTLVVVTHDSAFENKADYVFRILDGRIARDPN